MKNKSVIIPNSYLFQGQREFITMSKSYSQLFNDCRLLCLSIFIYQINQYICIAFIIQIQNLQFPEQQIIISKSTTFQVQSMINQDNPSMIQMNQIVLKVPSNVTSNQQLNTTNDRIFQSRVEQKKTIKAHDEEHIEVGEYLKSAVYGGLDGIINTLAVILSGIGSGVPPMQILAMGLSILVGDGIGMGLGDYLSAKAQKQFIKMEEKRELWEVKHKLLKQKAEIIEIYTAKDYKKEQAQRLAQLYATNDQAFVNIMMLQELGLAVDDESSPLIGGVVTFFAFIICGTLPLIPYFASREYELKVYLIVAIVVGGVQMFSLGFAKATLLGLNRTLSGLQSLALGAAAVAVGYGIGSAFE